MADVPFLTFYAWVSVWSFVFVAIVAICDLTRYLRYVTRFTEDIYDLLTVS
eukprot:CAMPEP_0176172338 /NCGR_PEP_ID=MMETSP0120_2-20121206/88291_1 /TAXON_ID=160619 /ORGANISM="Kryptoperidinium foliaceum, Strain CCMP 1326" /LENGTH=50 /DNA_ID=CAMNT_0017510315 /DNA_START=19 /DNA_END=167 /DNA_ORIENTATION=+